MGGTGKKKIEIKKIEDNSKKFVTFSKRRAGLFKKVEELGPLTGSQLATVVFSPSLKRLYTAGDLEVIDRFVNDTSDGEVAGLRIDSEVEVALRRQAEKNVEEVCDLNELMEMRSELERIRESLVKHLNSK